MRIGSIIDSVEKDLVRYRWNQYRGYLEVMEPYLAELTSSWHHHVETIVQQIEDEQQQADYYMHHADDAEDFRQFNLILSNSFFSSSYSFFEHEMIRFCRRSKNIHNASHSVTDINDRPGLDDAKEYITQLGVVFPCDADEWSEIQTYKRVRNSIVHRGEMIKSGDRFLKNYARVKGILDGTDDDPRLELELTRCFCDEALDTFQQFLLRVLEADTRSTPA